MKINLISIIYKISVYGLFVYLAGMHGRGSQASAPASDVAGRGRDAADRSSVPRRATWRFLNRADAAKIGADAAEIGADAARLGPYRPVSAGIGRIGRYRPVSAETARFGPKFKKKKKKRCKMHHLT